VNIIQSTEIDPTEWDDLVNSSDDTWLWHTWEWIDLLARVYSLQKHFFIARKSGKNIGGFHRLFRTGQGGLLGQDIDLMSWLEGFCDAGPFCIRDLGMRARVRSLTQMTEAATAWGRELKIATLSCQLPPLAQSSRENTTGVNPLVLAGWRDVSKHTLIADLWKLESDLWSDLSYDARRNVKHARSVGYAVQRVDWRQTLDEYYRVQEETYTRTGVSLDLQPRAYFEAIAKTADRGRSVLWVGLEPGGRPVAFLNSARFKNGSVANTGCCETDHLDSGINYLLIWHDMLGAKHDGCRWYDIGEVALPYVEGKSRGLAVFKSKFGGELHRLYRGEISLLDRPWFMRLAMHILPRPLRTLGHEYLTRLSKTVSD
jgi:hypothetical protein